MADVRFGHCQSYSENTSHTSKYSAFIFDVVDDIKLRNHFKILHFNMKMPLKNFKL